ncbi:MAG: hypothetical protein IPL46_14760 [Saprospiraceae bacterium]|nr:hypothetical protein [Saprospiraceae bacterium]
MENSSRLFVPVFSVNNSESQFIFGLRCFSMICFMVFYGVGVLCAQRDLKAITSDADNVLAELTGGQVNKIERAMLTKEDERSVTLSIRFVGFSDKEYRLQAAILNSRKEVMKNIRIAESNMPKSKQAEILLAIDPDAKSGSNSFLQSQYLKIRVNPIEGGISGLLGDTFGDFSLGSLEFLFELNKTWMMIGPGVTVNVKLVPFKNAASIIP